MASDNLGDKRLRSLNDKSLDTWFSMMMKVFMFLNQDAVDKCASKDQIRLFYGTLLQFPINT